ncbi:MAG: GntR family transcriptional regulator [Rhizobiaceae bacterium]
MLNTATRRTSADDVFDYLLGQINSLTLLPGTRISEVEIARQFDVSRQPVREAFIRLANRGLLLVRPQKATIVRRFSNEKILRARFIRTAVECEILRRACQKPLGKHQARLERLLEAQEKAIADQDIDRFHALDYDFHRALCAAAGSEFVFETILDNKAQVDRLCMLSLSEPAAMEELIEDHRTIVEGLIAGDESRVIEAITHHLSRLDDVIAGIRKSHADYFED